MRNCLQRERTTMQLNVACLALLFVATTVNGFVGMSNYERKLLSSLAANNVEKRGLAPMASSRWALPQFRHDMLGNNASICTNRKSLMQEYCRRISAASRRWHRRVGRCRSTATALSVRALVLFALRLMQKQRSDPTFLEAARYPHKR